MRAVIYARTIATQDCPLFTNSTFCFLELPWVCLNLNAFFLCDRALHLKKGQSVHHILYSNENASFLELIATKNIKNCTISEFIMNIFSLNIQPVNRGSEFVVPNESQLDSSAHALKPQGPISPCSVGISSACLLMFISFDH